MKPSEIQEEDINLLAETHGIKPEFNLPLRLHAANQRYHFVTHFNDRAKQKKKVNTLSKVSKRLIKAVDDFETALQGFEELSRNPTCDFIPLLHRTTDTERQRVRFYAELMEDASNLALSDIGNLIKTGDLGYKILIETLIDIYVVGTGARPGVSMDPNTKKIGGPMVRFIKDCLELLKIEYTSDFALRSEIRRVLNQKPDKAI